MTHDRRGVNILEQNVIFASVVKLADARDLKSLGAKPRTGSIPVTRTSLNVHNVTEHSYVKE